MLNWEHDFGLLSDFLLLIDSLVFECLDGVLSFVQRLYKINMAKSSFSEEFDDFVVMDALW